MAVVCSVCDKEFSSKASLASHRNRYHPKSNNIVKESESVKDESSGSDEDHSSEGEYDRVVGGRDTLGRIRPAEKSDESNESDEMSTSGDESDTTVAFEPGRDALGSFHQDKKRARNIIDIIRKTFQTPTNHFDATEAVSFQEAMKSKVPNPFENTQLANNQMYFLYVLYKIPDGHLTELTKFVNDNFKTVAEIWQLLFKEAQSKV